MEEKGEIRSYHGKRRDQIDQHGQYCQYWCGETDENNKEKQISIDCGSL